MRIFWTGRALKDLEEIYEFLSGKSEKAASQITRKILAKPLLLELNPQLGAIQELRLKSGREYRFLIENHYKIYYSIRKNSIFQTLFGVITKKNKLINIHHNV